MKRYMKMALLYAVLAMIGGVFYRDNDRTHSGYLSYWSESDFCNVCDTRGVPGSGDIPVLRYECGGFQHCRDRSHFAGCQLDSCPDTNQTQSFVKKYLIFLSILCILIAVQLM